MRQWLEPPKIDLNDDLLALLGGDRLAAGVLARRGLGEAKAARAFLDPDCYQPSPPQALPGMEAALERLLAAIHAGEHILVWGDFDVDGQTATTVLVETLHDLGGSASYHIPVRAVESHGVGLDVLKSLLAAATEAPKLLLTCDTGITAFEALEFARQAGLDVIVSDHHEPRRIHQVGEEDGKGLPDLPPALAVVTPRLLPGDHPLSGLPGVGVAYKLAEALYSECGRSAEAEKHLDLVALGIVADVAPQMGDARYLLQRGLKLLKAPQRAGLLAIYERAGLEATNINEEQIGFILGPRLNALGRLSDANPAVELLTTTDVGRARLLALELEGLNAQRQLQTSQVLRAATAQIESDHELKQGPVLVLSHPSWEAGVIGIVASRLVELYHKPVVLITCQPGQPGRASARSVEGLDITAAIGAQGDLLLGYGGHAMAAGFSILEEDIPRFSSRLSREVADRLGKFERPPNSLQIEGYLKWEKLDLSLGESLERLAPFGAGNPTPVFATRDLILESAVTIGRQGEHLQLRIADVCGNLQRVIWWGGGEFEGSEMLPAGLFDLAYTLRATSFRGEANLAITFVDFRIDENRSAPAAARTAAEIKDFRGQAAPLIHLVNLLREADSSTVQIWAEGEARTKLSQALPIAQLAERESLLRGRGQLNRARLLVIWSTPPGRAELKAALSKVKPEEVVVFGLDPGSGDLKPFLERLSGLVKGSINTSAASINLTNLAAALAHRERTVRLGVEVLAALGHISLAEPEAGRRESSSEIRLSTGGNKDPALAKELLEHLQDLLEETRAYRRYFQQFNLHTELAVI